MEWENELESKRRKVGVSMEKCCSNRLEQSCHLVVGFETPRRTAKGQGEGVQCRGV